MNCGSKNDEPEMICYLYIACPKKIVYLNRVINNHDDKLIEIAF